MEFKTVITPNGSRISFPAEYKSIEDYRGYLIYTLRLAHRITHMSHMIPLIHSHLARLDKALASPMLTLEFCVGASLQFRTAYLDAIRHNVAFSHFNPRVVH